MITILLFVLVIVAALLFAMWLSPNLKNTIASKWGAIGTALVAILAWFAAWFSGSPPTLP